MNISLDTLKAIVKFARSNNEPVESFAFQTFLKSLDKPESNDDTLTYILQVSKSMVGKNLWTDGNKLKDLRAGGMEVEVQPWEGMVKQALSLNVHF